MNFPGYVDFILLQDLVNLDYSKINYLAEISEPFETSAYPSKPPEYLTYLRSNIEFVKNRNTRIDSWVLENLS